MTAFRRPSAAEELAFHRATAAPSAAWPFTGHRSMADILAQEASDRLAVEEAIQRRLEKMGRCDE